MAAGAPGASSSRSAYSQFLDKLKHPSAKAVANDVHGFVTAFPPGLPRQEAARRVRVFLSDAAPRLLLAEAFAADGSDNQQELVEEGLEKFVVLKLYNVLFQQIPTDTGEDGAARQRAAGMALARSALDSPVGDVGRLVAQAAAELQKVNRYRAPRDKLGCMLNAYRLIENFVVEDAFQRDAAGDAPREEAFLNQVLTTTLKEAMPENFFSNVVFVSTYRHPSRISPEEQRCLQSFTNAAASLESGADAGDGADRAVAGPGAAAILAAGLEEVPEVAEELPQWLLDAGVSFQFERRSAEELLLGEVDGLLREYHGMARALRELLRCAPLAL